ncbi:extracellular solute-binding protein [Glaciihabitans sp. UYNi722]|uniref:ABC transporter substrate-binding protein n=1 Tax=Glaciihabitans sp. UYNi722 TaxID=3156344 RepID=UPI0033925B83
MRNTSTVRLTVLAVGAVATALVLSSCAAPGAGSARDAPAGSTISSKVSVADVQKLGKTTLKMWADQAEEPLMKDVVPAFEKTYPNVTVDITYKSFDDLVSTVVNAAASASAPDVFQGNIGYAVDGALVKAKLVRPLDDVAKVSGWNSGTGASTLDPAKWNAAGTTFGAGALYGMSPISEVQGIYYNKSKLGALGLQPPTTIAELETDLPTAEKAGMQPIMLGNSDQYAGTHIFSDIAVTDQTPAGIRAWIGGKSGSTFETSGNVKAADTMKVWAKAGYFGSGYDGLSNQDAIAKFAKGDGVFFVGGSWNGASLTSAEFGLSSLTSGGVGATASPWHISSKTNKTAAAIAWLDMLHTPTVGQEILDTGRLPVITDGVTSKDPLQEETLTALKETIAAGTQVGYYDWTTTDMLTVMGGGLQEVMAGRTSSEDFTKTVQAAWVKGHK